MITAATVSGILWTELPLECELAGEQNVATVASAVAEGRPIGSPSETPGGYKMEPVSALVAIAAAASFLKTCIGIYQALTEARKKQPEQKEFVAEAVKQGASFTESATKLAEAIYKALASG